MTKVIHENQYELVDVYQKLDDKAREQAIQFWIDNKLVNSKNEQSLQRTNLLVLVAKQGNDIVATASVTIIKGNKNNLLYQYSMFITEAHRTEVLRENIIEKTFALLEAWQPKILPQKPTGIVIMADIPGIDKLGWKAVGKTANKLTVFLREFAITEAPKAKVASKAKKATSTTKVAKAPKAKPKKAAEAATEK